MASQPDCMTTSATIACLPQFWYVPPRMASRAHTRTLTHPVHTPTLLACSLVCTPQDGQLDTHTHTHCLQVWYVPPLMASWALGATIFFMVGA